MAALPLPAWADDGLWTKTMENSKVARQWVAGDIDMFATLTSAGAAARKLHFRSHLSGWAKGQPVYTTTEIDPSPDATASKGASTIKMMNSFIGIANMGLEDGKTTRSDGQTLDGKTWTVFLQDHGNMGQKINAKIWVDADTGCVHQLDMDLHFTMYADGHMKTSYGIDAQGRCLTRQLDGDIDIIIPFKHAKMTMMQTPSNWIERPVASTP